MLKKLTLNQKLKYEKSDKDAEEVETESVDS